MLARILRRALTAFGIVVVLLLLIVLLLPLVLNAAFETREVRRSIAEQTRRALGREIVVSGPVRFQLYTLQPGLRIDGVRLANAAWSDRPDMLRLKTLHLRLRVSPLLTAGEIDVESALLEGAEIFLETDSDGRGNWAFIEQDFAGHRADRRTPAQPTVDADGSNKRGLQLLIERLEIRDASLSYRDGRTGRVREVVLHAADLSLRNTDLRGDFALSYGASDLRGDFQLTEKPLLVSADLHAKQIDLSDLLMREAGIRRGPAATAPGNPTSAPRAASLAGLLEERLPFHDLRRAAADLKLAIDALRYKGLVVEDLQLNGRLADGRLQIDPLSAQLAGGRAQATLQLDAAAKTVALAFEAELRDLALGRLLQAEGAPVFATQLDSHVRLSGQGATAGAILQSLEGALVFASGEGVIQKPALYKLVGPEVSDELETWLSPLPKLECIVHRMDFARGRGSSRVLVLNTNQFTVAGAGRIDLPQANQKLVFALTGKRMDLFSLADSLPIHIDGSFTKPAIQIAPAQVAERVFLDVLELPALPADLLGHMLGLEGDPGGRRVCEAARKKAGVEALLAE